jgi:carboxyl-terminal processing protease
MNALRATWWRTQRAHWLLVVVVVFFTGFALGHYQSISAAQSSFTMPAEAEEAFEPFWQVYTLMQSQYIDPIDMTKLVDGAITGMVDSLEDPYSGYMDQELYAVLNDDMDGTVEGIGATVHTNEETEAIEIVTVMPGTPAMKAGIMPGDIFVEVNGENVEGFSQLELVSKVRGPAGTEVSLVMRRGEELLEFTIERATIEIPNIETEVLENNIAYIKLNEFNAESSNQIENALKDLDVNSRSGLIIDLRGNPGGLLASVVDIASAFIEEGVILVEDFGDGQEQIFNANGNYSGVIVPIVVLVDESSASASELFAGALQDNGLATIVGEQTFGKGTVQTWSPLINGGGVRLTIARWLTPKRSSINDVGITPDIVVEWTPESYDDPNDPQLKAALDFLQSEVVQPSN